MSIEYTESLTKAANIILKAAEVGALKKAVLSKPNDKSIVRSVAMLKYISGRNMLQFETFCVDNKALHSNFDTDDLKNVLDILNGFSQINIICLCGEAEYRRSKSKNDTVIGYDKLVRSLEGFKKNDEIVTKGNNKEKKYILNGSEPFLKYLEVSDKNGRVYDKKQSKFRQINRFLELVRDVEKYLPNDEIRICDLCCGKSYLSFAVYHYFSEIRKMKVSMTGVDLKSDVVKHCSQVAKDLGYSGLEFVEGDIKEYKTDVIPQLVVSLHACDTATDIVLDKAIEWGTDVILSTPCCHHELNHTLNCPELDFIAKHSMLRQKLCDAATDALRLKRLEMNGYDVAALELIDPEETPKNIMLRGIKNKKFNPSSKRAKELADEYSEIENFLIRKK